MADSRKEYEVTVGGIVHTMLLEADDAARYGDSAVPAKKAAAAPQNKARAVENK